MPKDPLADILKSGIQTPPGNSRIEPPRDILSEALKAGVHAPSNSQIEPPEDPLASLLKAGIPEAPESHGIKQPEDPLAGILSHPIQPAGDDMLSFKLPLVTESDLAGGTPGVVLPLMDDGDETPDLSEIINIGVTQNISEEKTAEAFTLPPVPEQRQEEDDLPPPRAHDDDPPPESEFLRMFPGARG
jgi:hypothetical protein